MTDSIPVIRTVAALRAIVAAWRADRDAIALVPTMGALHNGHLTLAKMAKARCQRAVVSIFVNPTQFAPNEDLARYPRDEAGDVAKLASTGADAIWMPSVGEMYPDGFATRIVQEGAALGLEAVVRPHHFSGVATVCCKLFSQVTPDIAMFGEKDYQQLCVLKQMVRDLNLPLSIEGVPTVRETDGLALSSRNAYLTAAQRQTAPALYQAISRLAAKVADVDDIAAACAETSTEIVAAGFQSVDYVAVRDAVTLGDYDPRSANGGRVLVAARLGTTRLIDNVAITNGA